MRTIKILLSLAFVLLLGGAPGCGDSSSGTPSNSPGTGSMTLDVQAYVDADNFNQNGDNNPVNFQTHLWVRVEKNGQPVSGATVKIATSLGTFTLAENQGNPGDYDYTYAGYSMFHTLSAVKGADNVQGAQLVGPDIHKITAPLQNGTIGLNQTFTTTWQRTSVAQDIEIRTRDCWSWMNGMPVIADSGSYLLPGNLCFNQTRDNQYVRIARSNAMNIGGGVAGSVFHASVTNTVEPINVE